MKDFLTAKEIAILQEAHRSCRLRKSADRIKTVLALNEGLSYEQIAKLLLLDDTTTRRYYKEFKEAGIDGLLEDRYHGSNPLLTISEQQELTLHLKEHVYQTVKDIIVYVDKKYNSQYSVEGMTHLLRRLGFTYKKTKQIPGKVNLAKQEEFKKEYSALKQKMRPEDKLYFVDATHPQHNNMPFYGWIYKGDIKTIKGNTGRKRLNLNGALNLEITVLSEKTINTQAMKRLIRELDRKREKGDIYLIVDNAKYNHSRELKEFLIFYPEVHLIYLPPYSPNLNIIERLWRFFHKKHHDKYFEKFADFEKAVLAFFRDIKQYNNELRTLLTDSFQTLPT
jgi:transposase